MLSSVDETPEQWKARMGVGEPSRVAQTAGETRTSFVRHNDDGRLSGTQTEHRDGRVDATVFARPVPITSTMPVPG